MHKIAAKKFSLIELLVVIAIIGILSSMLLPSLGNARKTSQRSVCVNNLKQQNVALFMLDDNDGFLAETPIGNDSSKWKSQIYDFMGDTGLSTDYHRTELGEGVFKCPNSDSQSTDLGMRGGYGYNTYLSYQTLYNSASGRVTISSLTDPAETVAAGDNSDNDLAGLDWLNAWVMSPSWGDWWMSTRHNNGLNLMWVDGHVSQEKSVTVRAGKEGDSNYFWKRDKINQW